MPSSVEYAPTISAAATDGIGVSPIGRCVQERYLIEEPLGEGGVGTVYRARHIALDRPVALKVLQKQHSDRWVSRRRFDREARALASLAHPGVVAVTDYGMDGEAPFLVMELLEGESLLSRLARGALAPALACAWTLQLLDALAFVHAQGVVHRDIKPGNVFVEKVARGEERIKVLDFGLAKFVVPGSDASVTRSGELWGTPAYMAPEQVTGEVSDVRTDVYAVGLLLFEMLSGQRPFAGNELQLMQQQLAEPVPPLPRDLSLHAALDALIATATAKDAEARFASAEAMADALRAVMERGRTVVRRPAAPPSFGLGAALGRLLRAGAVLVSLLAIGGILIFAGIIYLLESPEGPAYRSLMKNAVPGLFDTSRSSPGLEE